MSAKGKAKAADTYDRWDQPAAREEADEFNINVQGTFMKPDDYRPGMIFAATEKDKEKVGWEMKELPYRFPFSHCSFFLSLHPHAGGSRRCQVFPQEAHFQGEP